MSARPAIRNAARALIVGDGAILLQVCRIGDRLFDILPGGTQEFGEPLAATVRREVLEETGLAVRVEGLRWISEFVERDHRPVEGDGTHGLQAIVLCTPEDDRRIAPATVPDEFQIGICWVPLAELPTIELVPHVVRDLLIAEGAGGVGQGAVYLGGGGRGGGGPLHPPSRWGA